MPGERHALTPLKSVEGFLAPQLLRESPCDSPRVAVAHIDSAFLGLSQDSTQTRPWLSGSFSAMLLPLCLAVILSAHAGSPCD